MRLRQRSAMHGLHAQLMQRAMQVICSRLELTSFAELFPRVAVNLSRGGVGIFLMRRPCIVELRKQRITNCLCSRSALMSRGDRGWTGKHAGAQNHGARYYAAAGFCGGAHGCFLRINGLAAEVYPTPSVLTVDGYSH